MKKDLHMILASAAMAMLGCEYPAGNHVPKKPSKGESKKCKTCVHYNKGNSKYFNSCSVYKVYVAPMKTACNNYERRKKK